MKRWKGALVAVTAVVFAGYVLLGNSVGGYKLCVLKGEILSQSDLAEQLIQLVELRYNAVHEDDPLYPSREEMDGLYAVIRQCVAANGFDKCEGVSVETKEGELTLLRSYFEGTVSVEITSRKENTFDWGIAEAPAPGCAFSAYIETSLRPLKY